MRRHSAFTLLELLIGLTFMMMVASIAFPKLRSWVIRTQIDRANASLLLLVDQAKRHALLDGETWSIRFSQQRSSLLLERQIPSGKRHPELKNQGRLGNTKEGSEMQMPIDSSLRWEFFVPQSQERIQELRFSPTGTISLATVHLIRHDEVVSVWETDRLTKTLRKKKG